MSALAYARLAEPKKTTQTITVEMLRIRDVIIDGVGIGEPATVTQVSIPPHDEDRRSLVLIDSENQMYFREYGGDVEVIIKD